MADPHQQLGLTFKRAIGDRGWPVTCSHIISLERGLAVNTASIIVLMCGVSVAGIAQTVDVLDVNGKLRYHAERTFGPGSIAISGVKAGYSQMTDSPSEWGQGGAGYSKR